jgi:hypothetical protein
MIFLSADSIDRTINKGEDMKRRKVLQLTGPMTRTTRLELLPNSKLSHVMGGGGAAPPDNDPPPGSGDPTDSGG